MPQLVEHIAAIALQKERGVCLSGFIYADGICGSGVAVISLESRWHIFCSFEEALENEVRDAPDSLMLWVEVFYFYYFFLIRMKNNLTNEAILTEVRVILNRYPKNFMGQGRDPARIGDVLIKIQEIWEKNPDLRLGQLITIAAKMKKPVLDVFNIEDEELFFRLVNFDKRK